MDGRNEPKKENKGREAPSEHTQYVSEYVELNKAFPSRSLSHEKFSEQNPNRGKHEKISNENRSPPQTPPPPAFVKGGSQKNISLSISPTVTLTYLSPREGMGTVLEVPESESNIIPTIKYNNNNSQIEREKTINSVIAETETTPKFHRRYRKNAVRSRCQEFARDLQAQGFVPGNEFTKREVRYWIIALDLAHDKTTVKQYMERLVIYGYFVIRKFGKYCFCDPGGRQLSLMPPKLIRGKIHASIYTDQRIKRRSY